MPEIKPLERKHVRALYFMTIRPEQQDFVSPNGVTMAEAPFEPGSEVFGIWQDDTPVGLLAVIDFSHPNAQLEPGEDPPASMSGACWSTRTTRNVAMAHLP